MDRYDIALGKNPRSLTSNEVLMMSMGELEVIPLAYQDKIWFSARRVTGCKYEEV